MSDDGRADYQEGKRLHRMATAGRRAVERGAMPSSGKAYSAVVEEYGKQLARSGKHKRLVARRGRSI